MAGAVMFCLTGKGFSWQFASNFLYYKPAQDAKSPLLGFLHLQL